MAREGRDRHFGGWNSFAGPSPAFAWAGAARPNAERATDPQGERHCCGPRRHGWFETHAGKGPRHGGHGHGPWESARFFGRFPGGPPFGRGARARRGDVRAAVLALLGEQPMHGYQIMQELEARSQGMWRPSPGSIYPALQLLQDQGLVKAEDVEGRRVFSLTPEGETAAAEAKTDTPPWQAGETEDERLKLRDAFFKLGGAVRQLGAAGSEDQVAKALEVLAEARRKIYALLAEGD